MVKSQILKTVLFFFLNQFQARNISLGVLYEHLGFI